MMMTELEAIYDSRDSFYKKAYVKERMGIKTLLSYDTEVVKLNIRKGTLKLLKLSTSSQTTLRHVREFLLQNNIRANSITINDKQLKSLAKKELELIVNKNII